MNVPPELKYTKTHEWVRVEDDGFVVGITDFAQQQLSDLTYVDLPSVGDEVSAESEVAVVESVKAASDVYAPVNGTIAEVNSALENEPELINTDAFIARFNTQRCREATGYGQPLDTAYMRHLGENAIVPLRHLVANERLTPQDRRRFGALLTTLEYRMQSTLTDGRGWTYNRIRIAAAPGTVKN